jgi:hypothetical protein
VTGLGKLGFVFVFFFSSSIQSGEGKNEILQENKK